VDLTTWERVGAFDLPGEPHGLVMSPDGKVAYVVQRKLNQVARVDVASRAITKTAPAGKRPDMIAISPDGKTLYITSRDDNKLLAMTAADLTIKAEVPTGDEPHGVAYRR
jgi:YVTN family beta-propeller protein